MVRSLRMPPALRALAPSITMRQSSPAPRAWTARLALGAAACALAACGTPPAPPAAPGPTSPAGAAPATAPSASATAAAPAKTAAAQAPATTPAAAPATKAAGAAPPAAATPPSGPGTSAAVVPAAAGNANAPASATARPPAPGTPPPFAEVTRDAKSTAGFFTLWTKDEKTWLEIPAERLEQPFFLGSSLASGLAERSFMPGLMPLSHTVVLRRVGNVLQVVALNDRVRTTAGSPLARTIAENYPDSLLAVAPLAAAPHPERKSLLVDAYQLLGGDLLALQTWLEASYRLPYGLDRSNSQLERSRTDALGTSLTFRSHYAIPRLPVPPAAGPGGPANPAALPNPPQAVPDPRSLLIAHTLVLAPLPAAPMRARVADQRVGYFTRSFVDYTRDDTTPSRRSHVIVRWRLEKKDPAAAVSEPKEPIRVVLDRNIPERWRATVREGVLEWNRAFESAGFRDALVVEQQPEGADWSTLEGGRWLAVRWFAVEGPSYAAFGQTQADPRSGEILRAAAVIPENWARIDRVYFRETEVDTRAASGGDALAGFAASARVLPDFAARLATCTHAGEAFEQTAFGLELLQLRAGDAGLPSDEVERFVHGGLKAVVVHEIGHALGLRHNFRASHGITPEQLRDPEFTARRGVSNSVMDYNPPNLALQGEPKAEYHMPGLGAYDLWAIEYGYREFAEPEERDALAALAARGDSDPDLAYATDPDLGLVDPSVAQFDLGGDPLAYTKRILALSRELWTRTQAARLPAADDYSVYRRNLSRGLGNFARALPLLARLIGGQYTSRSLAGSGRALVEPVPGPQQRAALELLLAEVFSSRSFRFDPAFLSRLGFDQIDRRGSVEFSLPDTVAGLQRGVLDTLMGDTLATRLADAEPRLADPKAQLGYAEVQARLAGSVWSELKSGGREDIDSLRRTLQREHVKRLASGLVRPLPAAAADVRAAHRQVAARLAADLKAALAAKGWSETARAHLADSEAALAEALRAPLVKQGV